MSRHRIVRALDYQEEYDGYDDVYGNSVEETDFCISPGTESQFLFDRSRQQNLSSYFGEEGVIPEEDEEGHRSESDNLKDSSNFSRPKLDQEKEVRLNSCLEELRNILGDSTPEHVMIDAVIKQDFDFEKSLNSILNTSETPKEQRDRSARRRNRDEDNDLIPAEGTLVSRDCAQPDLSTGRGENDDVKERGLSGFSLANLAEQQNCPNVNSDPIEMDTNTAQPNVHDTEFLSQVEEVEQFKPNSRATPTERINTLSVKPPLFSLADLAREHSSSPPTAFTKSAPPSTKYNANPPIISLAQFAQQQGGSPPNSSSSALEKERKPGIFTLSNLAENFHSKDKLKQISSVSVQGNKSGVSGGPPGLSLSALAAQHEQLSSGLLPNKETPKHSMYPPGFKPSPQIDLSALAAQHKVPQKVPVSAVPKETSSQMVAPTGEVLNTKASIFGQAICGQYSQSKLETRPTSSQGLKYPKFSCTKQISRSLRTPDSDSKRIVPFDFSTPSPDDIIQRKQKGAFSRTGDKGTPVQVLSTRF